MAPDFAQLDTAGKMVRLKDFKGKYVLLDFWASWCLPCRKDNPELIEAYKKFKDKGFTILQVSLDKPGYRSYWLNAIADDGIQAWSHTSDLQYFGGEMVKSYNITSIPQNFLLDPEGRIIAKGLHGRMISECIGELLK